jgi:hypothetical protein
LVAEHKVIGWADPSASAAASQRIHPAAPLSSPKRKAEEAGAGNDPGHRQKAAPCQPKRVPARPLLKALAGLVPCHWLHRRLCPRLDRGTEPRCPDHGAESGRLRQLYVEKISAVNAKRPMFNLMMKFVERGDTVLFHSLSRMGRDVANFSASSEN